MFSPSEPVPCSSGSGLVSGCIKITAQEGSTGRTEPGHAGLGYEIRVTEKLGLTPIVDYDSGRLGDVRNAITVETGRRYSVMEFKAAAIYHFGRSSD
jgi:hypothetical protein